MHVHYFQEEAARVISGLVGIVGSVGSGLEYTLAEAGRTP
jgi:hypothetical protein